MRLLVRLGEPDILRRKATRWTADWLASSKDRPDASKYRHPDIVATLCTMSHNKCFYCEHPLGEGAEQVDHCRDVTLYRSEAFRWDNLYLACKECNVGKPSDADIPVTACLDPCGTVAVDDHLEFVGEQPRPRADSLCGEATIRKYRLRRHALLYARSRLLRQLAEEYAAILERCNAEGGRPLDTRERQRLRAYAGPTEPFSACCDHWLRSKLL